MDHLEYAKKWSERPIFQGIEKDKEVLDGLISQLQQSREFFEKPIAWAKINDKGDLYDLRLSNNPYENNILPLYMRPTDYEQRQQIMQSKSKKS